MKIHDEVDAERERAHVKHGETSMRSDGWWAHRRHTILSEELGEVAQVLNDYDHHKLSLDEFTTELRKELVQTAAMAVDWIAAIDGHFAGPPHPDSTPRIFISEGAMLRVENVDGVVGWVVVEPRP